MLRSLRIKNIVLIDEAEIEFGEGFTALTGETGAGKSILLDALGLALGGKADARLVRQGEAQASVSAEFTMTREAAEFLRENGLETADSLIIRRVLGQDGKSRAFVNDIPVSVRLLAGLGENLVEIHGQHESAGLLDPSRQREILDSYAGNEKALAALAGLYAEWKKATEALAETCALAEAAKREEEFLRHTAGELGKFAPLPGEEEELAARRSRVMAGEKLAGSVAAALSAIDGAGLLAAQKTLLKTQGAGELFTPAVEALERAVSEAGTAEDELERIMAGLEFSESELERVEERLFGLRALARKYGVSGAELPGLLEETEKKLAALSVRSAEVSALEKRVRVSHEAYLKQALGLSTARKKAAGEMAAKVKAELKPLSMAGARFEVFFEELPEEKWGPGGIERVDFLAATNPGTALSPLAKTASGGEISRFMLALKVALSKVAGVPTIIFDEADTGTGGAVASAIGERLALLGRKVQVLVVTHLPQVAAFGNSHLKIVKSRKGGVNITKITALSDKERKEELARMLAGAEITEEARAAAGRLMRG